MKTLTGRQGELLEYIVEYIAANKYAPTHRDIAEHFSFKSLSTVHEHLANLEAKGVIRRDYNKERAIEVVDHEVPLETALEALVERYEKERHATLVTCLLSHAFLRLNSVERVANSAADTVRNVVLKQFGL